MFYCILLIYHLPDVSKSLEGIEERIRVIKWKPKLIFRSFWCNILNKKQGLGDSIGRQQKGINKYLHNQRSYDVGAYEHRYWFKVTIAYQEHRVLCISFLKGQMQLPQFDSIY